YPGRADLIARYDSHWQDSIIGPIHGTVEIKQRLMDAGIPVYGITNFSSEKWPAERARYDFLRDFRDIVVSGDIGIVKPDPAIYHALIERNGLDVSRSVFIDDSPKNVAGAEAVGMDAIHFTTPEALNVALRDRGLPA
ncbi:MAG: HAD-IA family hydrolase, partial [Pseudomonadota bacterium]